MSSGDRTVFIVDDDLAMQESLMVLLHSEGLSAEAFGSTEAFLAGDARHRRGCVIADIHLPGLSGLELQAELHRAGSCLPVIIITGQGDVPKAVTALKGGAVDFLEKPYPAATLLQSVREALSLQDGLNLAVDLDIDRFHIQQGGLTPREREVMDLVVAGQSNKIIAARLRISPRTVENHRARVMEKMGCDNLPALIHRVLSSQERHERSDRFAVPR